MNKIIVYIGINSDTDKRFIGIAKSENEIDKKYKKYSIVAFCETEEEANNIYNKYISDLKVLKDNKYENKTEKVVKKDDVSKE